MDVTRQNTRSRVFQVEEGDWGNLSDWGNVSDWGKCKENEKLDWTLPNFPQIGLMQSLK